MKRSGFRTNPKKRAKQLREWRIRAAKRARARARKKRSKPINPINRERKKAERLRAYGPPERRRAVRAMECAVPGCRRLSENAHLTTGGTGRKADASTVANLCAKHHRTDTNSLHKLGSVERFDAVHSTDMWARAQAIEEAYPTERAA